MYHPLHIFVFFIAGLSNCIPQQLFEGSKCHNADDSPGVCTLVPDCPPALTSIRRRGTSGFIRCGFDKVTEIVCCPTSTSKPTPTKETDDGDEDDKTEVRGTNVAVKSMKACAKYTKNLPIVLSYHIVGGENADVGEFPHMAALGFYSEQDKVYRFDCGGSLISNYHIVTAAHCIINVEQKELKIARMGVINVPATVEEPDPEIDYDVENITVFRGYDWKRKLNDIALVKLKKKVTFNDQVRPACLYTRSDDPIKLYVTGWGTIALGGEKSTVLQKAVLNPVPLQECNATYFARAKRGVIKSQICAADERSDACQGDSGGPLQILTNSSLATIVGITSYGIGCGSRYPGIYTRISSYLDWIEEIVWP